MFKEFKSNYKNEEIKKTVDDMNIEVLLFKTNANKKRPFSVRVRDLDAEENISSNFCPTLELAEKYYNETLGV